MLEWTDQMEEAPFASAVVFKKDSTVIAKKWSEQREKWVRIAQGKAGEDDAKVIQSAADIGGQIFIKKGEYIIKPQWYIKGWGYACIALPNYTELIGEGYEKTKFIVNPDGKTGTRINGINLKSRFENTDAHSVAIKGVSVDMTYVQGSGRWGDGISFGAASPYHGYDCKIEDCYVKGAPHWAYSIGRQYRITIENIRGEANGRGCLYMGGCFYGNVNNVWGWDAFGDFSVTPAEGYGLFLGDGSSRLNISNVHTLNNAVGGILINSLDKVNLDNVHCYDEVKCIRLHGGPFDVNISNFELNAKSSSDYAVYIVTSYRPSTSIHFSNGIMSAGYITIVDGGYNIWQLKFTQVYFSGADHIINESSGRIVSLVFENCESDSINKQAIVTNSLYLWITDSFIRGCGEGDKLYNLIEFSGNNCHILNNRLHGLRAPIYGIDLTGANVAIIESNTFFNCPNPINRVATIMYIRYNRNYRTENSGTASISADGTTTSFNIPHGLVSTPSFVNVTPKSGAPAPSSIDADSTNIILTFSTAPAAGTYYYWWEARV